MIFRIKVPLLITLVAGVFLTFLCASTVMASNVITEVSASPDLRRVAIKSEGHVGSHSTAVMSDPSRLVIDIPGAAVTQEPRVMGLEKDSALQVRLANTRAGAQVVLDFGASPVPDHKVRQIDNYLIVLLGEWQPEPRAQRKPEAAKAPARPPVSRHPEKARGAVIQSSGSELLIKSAEEVNGTIVLKVAKRTEPQRTYRIDLGVDFQHLGFTGASVYPVGGRRDVSAALPGKTSSWDQPSAHGTKMGPRKMHLHAAAGTKPNVATRKPKALHQVSALARGRGNSQGPLNKLESSRVRTHTQLVGGITRKNLVDNIKLHQPSY
jgi:hypothetical protein